MWDYNKEINVTLEDALFSAKSLAIMFGDGKVRNLKKGVKGEAPADAPNAAIMKTEIFTYKKGEGEETAVAPSTNDTNSKHGWNPKYTAPNGSVYTKINPKFYAADTSGKEGNITTGFEDGQKYFCSYDLKIEGSVIEVSSNSFPGTLTYRAPLRGNKILANQIGELLETVA